MYQTSVFTQQFIKTAILNPLQNQTCDVLHPGSCNDKSWYQAVKGSKGTIPLYLIVHIIPFLLKSKKVAKNPRQEVKKIIQGLIKSMLFVISTEFFIRRVVCVWTKLCGFSGRPAIVFGPLVLGFPLAIFQSSGRQMQIGLLNLKVGIQTLYLLLRRSYPSLYINHGQILLFTISIAVVSYYYMTRKQLFKEGYQKTLDLIYKDI